MISPYIYNLMILEIFSKIRLQCLALKLHTQKHIHRHTYTPPLKLGQAQIRHFLNEVIYQQLDTKLEQQHHLVGTGERLRVPLPLLHSGHYSRFQSPADQRFQDENSETTGKVLHAYSETLQITARLCGLIVCTH